MSDEVQIPEKLGSTSPVVKVWDSPRWVAECSCGWWVSHSLKVNAKRRLVLHLRQSHPAGEYQP